MKNILIIILCSAAILGLLILGVALKNSSQNFWAVVLTALIIVPAYFIYSAVISMNNERKNHKTKVKRSYKKAFYSKSNDNGKILQFPSNRKSKNK